MQKTAYAKPWEFSIRWKEHCLQNGFGNQKKGVQNLHCFLCHMELLWGKTQKKDLGAFEKAEKRQTKWITLPTSSYKQRLFKLGILQVSSCHDSQILLVPMDKSNWEVRNWPLKVCSCDLGNWSIQMCKSEEFPHRKDFWRQTTVCFCWEHYYKSASSMNFLAKR